MKVVYICRKYVKTTIPVVLSILLCCLSCNAPKQNVPKENGWYYVVDGEKNDVSHDPIVTVKEFTSLKLDSAGNPPRYQIVGTISKHKWKKWEDATEKAVGKQIGFVFNNEVITAPKVNMKLEKGRFAISNPYGHDLKLIFHQIRREMADSIHSAAHPFNSYEYNITDTLPYKKLEKALFEELQKPNVSSRVGDYMQSVAYQEYKDYIDAHRECIDFMFKSFLFEENPQGLYGYLIDDIIKNIYPSAPSIRDMTDKSTDGTATIKAYQEQIRNLM